MANSLENIIFRCIQRYMVGRYLEHHALVTAYDSKNYLAKVKLMPGGQETGFLPIETGHIGKTYGMVSGLQPGSGGSSQWGAGMGMPGGSQSAQQQNDQALGDQVIVRFQEGDIESGKIVQRVHSDQDTVPEAKSGEVIIWTKFKQDKSPGPDAAPTGQSGSDGQTIFFKNDGSLSTTDGSGVITTMDGKGNYTVTAL